MCFLRSFCFAWVWLYPLCCQILYHHGITMIVPWFTFLTENFVIRCDQVTPIVPLWARLYQYVLCKKPLLFSSSSRYHNLGPSESAFVHCACPNPVPLLLAAPLEVHEMIWKCLDFHALGFLKALLNYFHQPNSLWIPVANQAIHAICLLVLLRLHHFGGISDSVDSCSGSPRSSSFVLPLLSCNGFSLYLLTSNTESFDENDGEVGEGVVEEELADKPGTTNCTQFDILQSIILPFFFFAEMWFLTADPAVCTPMILTEFLQGKNCGSFFKKHNCHEWVQIFDVYRRFFSGLHLAVGRHHRRRTSRCPHGLQLSRVKVLLADHMHTRSWIHHKLSALRLFCWRSREYPFLFGKVAALSFSLNLYMFLARFRSLASGTSLLSFSLFMGPVLKFHSVRTSLMRNFDTYFSRRWAILFPDTCMT